MHTSVENDTSTVKIDGYKESIKKVLIPTIIMIGGGKDIPRIQWERTDFEYWRDLDRFLDELATEDGGSHYWDEFVER